MSEENQVLTSQDISYAWTNASKTEFVLHYDGTGIVRGFVGPGRKSFSIRVDGKGILTFRRMVDTKHKAAFLWSEGHRVSYAGGKAVVISRTSVEHEVHVKTQKSLTEGRESAQHGEFTEEAFPYLHKEGMYAKLLGRTTDLVRNINRVMRDDLRDEYLKLIDCAPNRADRDKRYFVDEHNGIPSGASTTNRYEEHLAMALWNLKQVWPRDDGSQFCLLDYQVPLQARQSDRGIGKVDLIGLTTKGRLMVIELKVKPDNSDRRGETPASALFQGLRYAAIVQANQNAIAEEIESRNRIRITPQPPIVQILAPENWWQGWTELGARTRADAGYWEVAFNKLTREIEDEIGVSIECASLEGVRLTFGGGGRPPRLDRAPTLSYIIPGVQ